MLRASLKKLILSFKIKNLNKEVMLIKKISQTLY